MVRRLTCPRCGAQVDVGTHRITGSTVAVDPPGGDGGWILVTNGQMQVLGQSDRRRTTKGFDVRRHHRCT